MFVNTLALRTQVEGGRHICHATGEGENHLSGGVRASGCAVREGGGDAATAAQPGHQPAVPGDGDPAERGYGSARSAHSALSAGQRHQQIRSDGRVYGDRGGPGRIDRIQHGVVQATDHRAHGRAFRGVMPGHHRHARREDPRPGLSRRGGKAPAARRLQRDASRVPEGQMSSSALRRAGGARCARKPPWSAAKSG